MLYTSTSLPSHNICSQYCSYLKHTVNNIYILPNWYMYRVGHGNLMIFKVKVSWQPWHVGGIRLTMILHTRCVFSKRWWTAVHFTYFKNGDLVVQQLSCHHFKISCHSSVSSRSKINLWIRTYVLLLLQWTTNHQVPCTSLEPLQMMTVRQALSHN